MAKNDPTGDASAPTIRTERLILRLADPWSSSDCEEIISLYNDSHVARRSASGINTIDDVQEKFKRHGPRSDHCTLAPPPRGMYLLIYLPPDTTGSENSHGTTRKLIGNVLLSDRPEMPYPDLGFALSAPYEGFGYATEAGLAALNFWRDTLGIKNIFFGTAPDNAKAQKLAERLGFERAGTFDVVMGYPPNETRATGGLAYVLPGTKWIEGKTMELTIGKEVKDSE